MGLGELSPLHLIIVLVIALIVIGPGKLPDVGAALGKSIREFRKAASDVPGSPAPDVAAAVAALRPPLPRPPFGRCPSRPGLPARPPRPHRFRAATMPFDLLHRAG